MRCSLPDFDPAQWDPAADQFAAIEASNLAQELTTIAKHQGIELDHELDRDGCPWGWAQSRFISSLSTYVGQRTLDSATRQPSLRMQRRMMRDDEEPLELLGLVRQTEAWEDGAYAYFAERVRG